MDMSKSCCVCGKEQQIMKRCTRCQQSFYWQCQVTDWPQHKHACHTVKSSTTENGEKAIWNEESSLTRGKITWTKEASRDPKQKPYINFDKAFKDLEQNAVQAPIGNKYLYHNEELSDAPSLDSDKETVTITIKAHKTKHRIAVNTHWSGQEIWKFLSYSIQIPLDKLKLIHKGKKMDKDTITSCITNKAVFQAIGEQAEDEDGVNKKDINVMMTQLSVDRNEAVRALKETGDVLDAMLKVANK